MSLLDRDNFYFFLLSFTAIFDIIFFQYYQSSLTVSGIFFLFLLEILLIETILVYVIGKYTNKTFNFFLYSFLTVLNILTFKLVNYSDFMRMSYLKQSLVALSLFLIFFYIFKNFKSYKRLIFIIFLFLVSLLSSIIIYYENSVIEKEYKEFFTSKTLPILTKKPNIYLIGIDGLIPPALGKKFHGFDYVIDSSIKIQVKNSFAPKIPTALSFMNILSLSQDVDINQFAFSGQINSPLYEIFQKNDYKIFGGFTFTNMGTEAGKFVNDFRFYQNENQRFRQSTSCMDLTPIFRYIPKYLGLCSFAMRHHANFLTNITYMIFPREKLNDNSQIPEEVFLQNYINELDQITPKLFIYHLRAFTKHTPYGFDKFSIQQKNEWSSWYEKKYHLAHEFLNNLYKLIMDNDPESIVLIFGDHGTFYNRYAYNNQDKIESENDIQDLYGIAQYYLNTNNKCIYHNKYTELYSTTSRELLNIIDCLSDNNSLDQFIRSINEKNPAGKLFNFTEYLYE